MRCSLVFVTMGGQRLRVGQEKCYNIEIHLLRESQEPYEKDIKVSGKLCQRNIISPPHFFLSPHIHIYPSYSAPYDFPSANTSYPKLQQFLIRLPRGGKLMRKPTMQINSRVGVCQNNGIILLWKNDDSISGRVNKLFLHVRVRMGSNNSNPYSHPKIQGNSAWY